MTILEEVAKERQRQVKKGYDAEHDDMYVDDELAYNAIDIVHSTLKGADAAVYEDDFGVVNKYADDPRKRMIVAISLLVAYVEAMDRLTGT